VAPAFSGIPTGQVAVSDGAGGLCGITLSSGKGSCLMASTAAGARTLTATYGGDSNFNASAGAASQTVNIANTATAIVSTAPNPAVLGQPVTVRFAVTAVAPGAGTPTGTVSVKASTGESCSNSVASGSCALTFTTAGSRNLTAAYSGDTNFAASTSAAVTVTESVGDFSITATPASQTISSGHQGMFQITLTAIGGLTGNVNLTCSGTPPNSTCTVSPGVVSLGGSGSISTTVNLSTARNVTHGTFTLTFTGTLGSGNPATGGLTHSTSASLTVK
jgi:Big-like domain-containing protein